MTTLCMTGEAGGSGDGCELRFGKRGDRTGSGTLGGCAHRKADGAQGLSSFSPPYGNNHGLWQSAFGSCGPAGKGRILRDDGAAEPARIGYGSGSLRVDFAVCGERTVRYVGSRWRRKIPLTLFLA